MPVELFNYETTYKTDYHGKQNKYFMEKCQLPPNDIHENKRKIKSIPKIDCETLCPFKENSYIPSDMYFREKPMVQTNPMKIIKKEKYQRVTAEERTNARNTRPRVYMVPQVCVDDIPENVMYGPGGLVDNVYTSDWAKSVELAAPVTKVWPETNTTLEKDSEPVRFKSSHPCLPLSLDRHEEVKKWDKLQLRAGVEVDPTKSFWLRNRHKVICTVCDPQFNKLLSSNETKEITNLVKENKLSLSYDIMMPGYTGYIPKIARGVKPECKKFTRTEPWLTTLMTLQGNYKKI